MSLSKFLNLFAVRTQLNPVLFLLPHNRILLALHVYVVGTTCSISNTLTKLPGIFSSFCSFRNRFTTSTKKMATSVSKAMDHPPLPSKATNVELDGKWSSQYTNWYPSGILELGAVGLASWAIVLGPRLLLLLFIINITSICFDLYSHI